MREKGKEEEVEEERVMEVRNCIMDGEIGDNGIEWSGGLGRYWVVFED